MDYSLAITFEGTVFIDDVQPGEYDENLVEAVVQKFFDRHNLHLDVVSIDLIEKEELDD